jgi:hypothetical protein
VCPSDAALPSISWRLCQADRSQGGLGVATRRSNELAAAQDVSCQPSSFVGAELWSS